MNPARSHGSRVRDSWSDDSRANENWVDEGRASDSRGGDCWWP